MENKYSKILDKLWRIPMGCFMILFGAATIVLSFWFTFAISYIGNILVLGMIMGGGFIIHHGLGKAFFNDQYQLSGLVIDGDSVIEPVETPKYLKRRMWFCFIEFLAYTLLAIYYIVLGCIFSAALLWYLVFAVVAVVFAVIFFLIAAKTKTEDLANKQ